MGTNFYIRRKLSDIEKFAVIKSLMNDDYNKAKILLNQEDLEIHIGKRSSGWKFLWNAHYFKYFNPNKESILNFLKHYGEIYDEYGRFYSFEDFWNDEIKDFLDDGLDLKEYYESPEYKSKYTYSPEQYKMTFFQSYNLNVNKYGEFYIDNMRFTVDNEFS